MYDKTGGIHLLRKRRIEKTRDVIEWKLDDVLDINGWDIKKALQLLHNSNPTVFEWCACLSADKDNREIQIQSLPLKYYGFYPKTCDERGFA